MTTKRAVLKSLSLENRLISDYACQIRACNDLITRAQREEGSLETTRSTARDQRVTTLRMNVQSYEAKIRDAERELDKLTRDNYRYHEYMREFSFSGDLPGGWND